MELRPYQRQAVESIYAYLRAQSDNPCVVIPTGGGKTPVIATVCRDAVKQWHGRVLILAHVKELLEQAAEKLQTICPEVRFGVYSAGLGRRESQTPIVVAGIQSVYKRARELDPFDLVIVDEAHMIPPEGDGMYRQFLKDAQVVNPHLRVIGLTATPFRLKSGDITGPDQILNGICFETGVRELIRDGYKSEWICFEHTGYARRKAVAWWKQRSPDPIPETAERAVEIAQAGGVALTKAITVRAVAGDPYERIVDYELGPLPEPVEIVPNNSTDDDVPF